MYANYYIKQQNRQERKQRNNMLLLWEVTPSTSLPAFPRQELIFSAWVKRRDTRENLIPRFRGNKAPPVSPSGSGPGQGTRGSSTNGSGCLLLTLQIKEQWYDDGMPTTSCQNRRLCVNYPLSCREREVTAMQFSSCGFFVRSKEESGGIWIPFESLHIGLNRGHGLQVPVLSPFAA